MQELIKLLEKITGQKVILETLAEPETLSNRQKGAQHALATKGFDDWTINQYALAYFLTIFSKRKLTPPYNNMPVEQIAEDAGMKYSTLSMAVPRIRFVINGEGLQSGGPKIEGYIKKFAEMSEQDILNLAMGAFNDAPAKIQGAFGKSYKNADFATQKQKQPTMPTSLYSNQDIIELNKGEKMRKSGKKWIRRGNNIARVDESYVSTSIALIEGSYIDKQLKQYSASLPKLIEHSKRVNKIVKEAKGNKIKEIILAESDSYNNSFNELFGLYEAAKKVSKNEIAQIYYENCITELSKKVSELKSKKSERIDEWFFSNSKKKLGNMLDRAAKLADSLNAYAALYPEDWDEGIETKVKEKLQAIWNLIQSGGSKKVVTENVEKNELNEFFAKGAFKKLLSFLDKIYKQVDKANSYAALYPEDGNQETSPEEQKELLKKVKKVWQVFAKGEQSNAVSYAKDPINSLSVKQNNNKTKQMPLSSQNDEAMTG